MTVRGGATAAAVPGIASIAMGYDHSCVLLDDGTMKCWGFSDSGQLGQGDTVARGDGPGEMGDLLPPVNLGSGRTAVAISAGYSHSCVLLDDGAVKCWGFNDSGQLGQGDTVARGDGPDEMGDNLPAVDLGSGRTAVAISAGGHASCALLDNASLKCWGWNYYGELGQGDTANRGDGPGEMGDSLPAVSLGAGRSAVPASAAVVRLAPGTYQLRVVAVSSAGESTPSGASAPVTVTAGSTGVPGAPSHVGVVAGSTTSGTGSSRVSFRAAASNGSAITGYRASCTSSNGGVARSKTGAVSPLGVTGLTTGKLYVCTVRAMNVHGAGPWSAPSAAVIVGPRVHRHM